MCGEPVERNLRQYQPAVRLSGDGPGTPRPGAGTRARTVIASVAQQIRGSAMIRLTLGGLLIATAILGATYLAAETVAEGAGYFTPIRGRVTQSSSSRQRRTTGWRASHCQRLAAEVRDTCIAKAHADETRARSMAAPASQSHVAAFRSQTDAAIDAGGSGRDCHRAGMQHRGARTGRPVRNTGQTRIRQRARPGRNEPRVRGAGEAHCERPPAVGATARRHPNGRRAAGAAGAYRHPGARHGDAFYGRCSLALIAGWRMARGHQRATGETHE